MPLDAQTRAVVDSIAASGEPPVYVLPNAPMQRPFRPNACPAKPQTGATLSA